ncbi:DUF6438 domain-containing protein [Chloroflexota bacterium]
MKKIWLVVTILILSVSFAGCSRTQTPQPSDIKDVVITLERTVCFGACPEYTLTILGDGTVTYEGRRFVKIEGTITTTISEEKISQLLSEFERVDYFALNDSYEDFGATDMPSAITSLTINDVTKTVRHYHGDFTAPEQLTELENRIDEIVNSDQWTK